MSLFEILTIAITKNRLFKVYQDELLQSIEQIEKKKSEILRERNQRDAEHNLNLAMFKKERDLSEMEYRYFGHIEIMNNSKMGDLIFETPLSKKNKLSFQTFAEDVMLMKLTGFNMNIAVNLLCLNIKV